MDYNPPLDGEDVVVLLPLLTDSDDAAGLFYLGVALHTHNVPVAEKTYRRAGEAGVAEAWFNLGNLLAGQPGRAGEAEDAYRRAGEAGHAGAWFNLGLLLADQPGREAEAEAALERYCPEPCQLN